MTNDKADEWCHSCKEYDHNKHCCPRFNRVIRETVEEVKPNAEQKWIPVSERLPIPNSVYEDVSVYYLVQNEYGDMMVATFVQFPGGARVWQQMYQYGAIMENIVAWMPLPEPYRKVE